MNSKILLGLLRLTVFFKTGCLYSVRHGLYPATYYSRHPIEHAEECFPLLRTLDMKEN